MNYMEINNIWIGAGYGGKVQCKVSINNEIHIIEIEELEKLILDTMQRDGYTVTLEPRQKYRRVSLNKINK